MPILHHHCHPAMLISSLHKHLNIRQALYWVYASIAGHEDSWWNSMAFRFIVHYCPCKLHSMWAHANVVGPGSYDSVSHQVRLWAPHSSKQNQYRGNCLWTTTLSLYIYLEVGEGRDAKFLNDKYQCTHAKCQRQRSTPTQAHAFRELGATLRRVSQLSLADEFLILMNKILKTAAIIHLSCSPDG